MLRADYPRDERVRATVDSVVAELVFLGRTDRTWAQLGASNAPRGMRWWWTALTGEAPAAPTGPPRRRPGPDPDQLSLDEVLGGYGG